jgi:hypothetical protein
MAPYAGSSLKGTKEGEKRTECSSFYRPECGKRLKKVRSKSESQAQDEIKSEWLSGWGTWKRTMIIVIYLKLISFLPEISISLKLVQVGRELHLRCIIFPGF